MNLDSLKLEVKKARNIFDRYALEIHKDYFKDFPRGCCGNASLLLGNWLIICGFKNTKLVQSKREDDTTHSWLIVNDFIVDITSDQFEDQGYGIYPITSEYHATFKEQLEVDCLEVNFALEKPLDIFIELMKQA